MLKSFLLRSIISYAYKKIDIRSHEFFPTAFLKDLFASKVKIQLYQCLMCFFDQIFQNCWYCTLYRQTVGCRLYYSRSVSGHGVKKVKLPSRLSNWYFCTPCRCSLWAWRIGRLCAFFGEAIFQDIIVSKKFLYFSNYSYYQLSNR